MGQWSVGRSVGWSVCRRQVGRQVGRWVGKNVGSCRSPVPFLFQFDGLVVGGEEEAAGGEAGSSCPKSHGTPHLNQMTLRSVYDPYAFLGLSRDKDRDMVYLHYGLELWSKTSFLSSRCLANRSFFPASCAIE